MKSCGKHAYCSICRPEIVVAMRAAWTPELRAAHGAVMKGTGLSPSGKSVKDERIRVRLITGWVLRARAVWVQHNGLIPKGHLIHHEDEDKQNDGIENLRCLARGEHSRHHLITQRRDVHSPSPT